MIMIISRRMHFYLEVASAKVWLDYSFLIQNVGDTQQGFVYTTLFIIFKVITQFLNFTKFNLQALKIEQLRFHLSLQMGKQKKYNVCSKYIKVEWKTSLGVSSKQDNSICMMSTATSQLSPLSYLLYNTLAYMFK